VGCNDSLGKCGDIYRNDSTCDIDGTEYTCVEFFRQACSAYCDVDQEVGLKTIDLNFKETKRTDQYGNRFRYRAKVKDTHDAQLGRWAWDVYLMSYLENTNRVKPGS
jgi:hypothetical protein